MRPPELGPDLIEGGLHADARGTVAFVNEFDFKGVDRFYVIRSRRPNEARGWVGHRRERKWFFAVQGKTMIAVVEPDDWRKPSGLQAVQRFVLSADCPGVLCVPPGHATGSVNLSSDAVLMVFSSGRIEGAKVDDYRFAADMWPIMEQE